MNLNYTIIITTRHLKNRSEIWQLIFEKKIENGILTQKNVTKYGLLTNFHQQLLIKILLLK